MTGELLELAEDAGALLVVIGALAEVDPSGVLDGDGLGDVGGGVEGGGVEGGVVGGFVGGVVGGLVPGFVGGLPDDVGLLPGFDELGDGSPPGFDDPLADVLEPGVTAPVGSAGPPGRWVEPSVGSSASRPLSASSSFADWPFLTLPPGGSCWSEVAPSVTTVPSTAASSAPAPAATRLRRAPPMMERGPRSFAPPAGDFGRATSVAGSSGGFDLPEAPSGSTAAGTPPGGDADSS
jgi:hypothetical protein